MDFLGVPLFIASIAIMAFAGFTKGLVGFAMPMIIFSSLTVLSNSEVALSLLIIPTLIANIVQAFQDGINAAVKTVLKFKTFILILAVSMIITTQVFYLVPTNLISFLLGSVIVIYVLLELFKISVLNKVRVEGLYKSILALISGFCGGISGVWGPTTVIYLLNNNIQKSEIIRAQGVIYGIGSIALFFGHLKSGVLSNQAIFTSLLLAIPALAGLFLGALCRTKMNNERFKSFVLMILLLIGIYMLLSV